MTAAGDHGFDFGGRLSLDLTWTLRYRVVAPTELLVTPDDLGRWCDAAVAPVGVPTPPGLLDEARRLREAVHDAADAVIGDRPVRRSDRAVLNRWAARPAPFVRLDPQGGSAVVLPSGAEVEAVLAAVAIDAVELLASADGRLRRCEGPSCSLLFHDASRPGRRRWCSTERCGNRVNTATYRHRRAGGPTNP